jgi:hypothetical protein
MFISPDTGLKKTRGLSSRATEGVVWSAQQIPTVVISVFQSGKSTDLIYIKQFLCNTIHEKFGIITTAILKNSMSRVIAP